MSRKILGLGIGAAMLASIASGGIAWYDHQQSSSSNGDIIGGPVELPSTQGDFSLTQLADDQIAVLSFGYTYCPDVCPMNQSVKRQALQKLSAEQRERVVPVMVSVDPERDTLERLKEYMGYFGEEFIGVTGSRAQLEELAERYGVIWRRVETPESSMEYTIDHSASLYLVNPEGKLLQRVLYSPTPHALVSALQGVLEG
ncbi:SCO family protein [Halomonas sp. ZH2S]|uniref:SCO family protein n=1 Tax=Vreelandella zhuhanensis TaxID=2684210 RepID=A0A7X3H0C0_9GAMM|nr:SCO family protein [Halomonas zhuhanensis]MWJ28041.1 SCO family protein [Halomonas zhuhanensis]